MTDFIVSRLRPLAVGAACVLTQVTSISAAELIARVEPMATQTAAWWTDWADLDGNGTVEVFYLSRYGVLTCQDLAGGKVRWTRDLAGKSWHLKTADLDGDGRREVLAVVGKSIICLNADGATRWQFDSEWPMSAVTVGRLLNKDELHLAVGGEDEMVTILDIRGQKVKSFEFSFSYHPHWRGMDGARSSVHTLDAGDTDGDGLDELLVLNTYWQFALMQPRNDKNTWLWNLRDDKNNWMYDARLLDLDGDGRAEAYVGGRSFVACISPEGKEQWRKSATERAGDYAACRLAKIDADGDGRAELAVSAGACLSVFQPDGRQSYFKTAHNYFFNDIADALPTAPGRVLLGSVTGADRNVYAVSFDGQGKDGIGAFTEPSGNRRELQDTLWKIHEQVRAAPVDTATPKRTYYFSWGGGGPDLQRVPNWSAARKKMQDAYPYDNVVFYSHLNYREPGRDGQGIEMPAETLLKIADAVEADDHKHIFIVGHGTDAHLSLDTTRQWLERSPKTCLGILTSELNVAAYHLPENAKHKPKFDRFVDEHLVPCIDLAAKHGKPTYLLMKQNWWSMTPAMKSMADRIFTEERRRWIIPQVEDSMTVCPEVNLMGRVGLWRSGLVDSWALNIINDQLVVDKMELPLCCDPHSTLRHMVAYAALGTDHFKLKLGELVRDGGNKFDLPHDKTGSYAPHGMLTYDLMIHLLGKGLLDVPTRDNLVGVASVAFCMAEPSPDYVRATGAHDVPYAIPDASAGGLLTGYDWPHMPTRPTYAPQYLLNINRHGHGHLPETPYGLPLIVPKRFNGDTAWVKRQWTTDGISILENDTVRSAADARANILKSFQDAAEELPLRATNCFWSATRRADGTIRLTLVSTDYLDPTDCDAELIARNAITKLRDILADKAIPFDGRRAKLTIPAGAFRIVDVQMSNELPRSVLDRR